jgi:hypothetical protein
MLCKSGASCAARGLWCVSFSSASTDQQFGDHYSYAALAYFLLIKPLVVLPSAIAFLALLPLAIVLFPLLPIYLRAARAFGWYQADMAMSNV